MSGNAFSSPIFEKHQKPFSFSLIQGGPRNPPASNPAKYRALPSPDPSPIKEYFFRSASKYNSQRDSASLSASRHPPAHFPAQSRALPPRPPLFSRSTSGYQETPSANSESSKRFPSSASLGTWLDFLPTPPRTPPDILIFT